MWLWWFLLWLWRSCDSPHPPHLPLCLVMYWWTCACLLVVAVRGAFATTMPAELVYRRVVHTVYASRCCHDLDAVVAFTALANPVTRLLIGLWPSCRSLCLLRPTNPVPHDLSAGRCLGTVWYHCDITMATLGLNAGNGHVVSRSRPSVLSPEAVLQGRLRVVALAVIGDASLTPSRVRVVLFCLQP